MSRSKGIFVVASVDFPNHCAMAESYPRPCGNEGSGFAGHIKTWAFFGSPEAAWAYIDGLGIEDCAYVKEVVVLFDPVPRPTKD